ncbi:MAG: hypothetical protein ABW140_01860, partial [Candidatus Sedimenticola sp. 6PFRAG1]
MQKLIRHLWESMLDSIRDLTPIVAVIAFFQLAVLQQPIPNLTGLLVGTMMVVIGFTNREKSHFQPVYKEGESN